MLLSDLDVVTKKCGQYSEISARAARLGAIPSSSKQVTVTIGAEEFPMMLSQNQFSALRNLMNNYYSNLRAALVADLAALDVTVTF